MPGSGSIQRLPLRTATCIAMLCLLAGVAQAADVAAPALTLQPKVLGPPASFALEPEADLRASPLADALLPDSGATLEGAPAAELATGLDVRVGHQRRKLRERAVEWMADRSSPVGVMTDLLLGGADSGWHVVVDPSGDDKYILEWKLRFE
jgi:hypothetical protein